MIKLIIKNKAYLTLLLINLFSALGAILLYRGINEKYGEVDMYLFTYYKRIMSFLAPVSLIGLGVTLVRKVSVDVENSINYVVLSLLATLILPIVLLCVFIISPDIFDKIFFAGEPYGYLVIPLIVNLIGLSFFAILMSYLRGVSKFIYASSLNLVFVICIPFLLLLFKLNLVTYLNLYGVLLIIASFLIVLELKKEKVEFKVIKYRDFFIEGLHRLIGDISYYFLLLAPSYFLLLFTKDIVITSAIGFCQVIMNSTTILIKPISFVKLTSSAKMSYNKDYYLLKKDFFNVTFYTFIIFVIITIILSLLIELIIGHLFSKNILTFLEDIKLFLVVIPFFGVYVSGRSYIDGITNKAVMSFVNFMGLLVFLLLTLSLTNWLSSFLVITLAFISAFVAMDLIMIFYMKKYKI